METEFCYRIVLRMIGRGMLFPVAMWNTENHLWMP